MSDKPAVEGRAEPAPDPVDEFMRQLSTNAARHRRSMSQGGGAAKLYEANESPTRRSEGAVASAIVPQVPEAPLAPAIEGVAVAKLGEGCWAVEAKDTGGSLIQAFFQGPDAEGRAREYARWKYGEET